MLQGKRNQKIAIQIRERVAAALIEKTRDPRVGFVTVTDVDLSDDLRYSTVYISVFGDEKQKKGALIALNHAKGFFQRAVAEKSTLRFIPKIRFALDESIDKGMEIDKIIHKIKMEKEEDELSDDADQSGEAEDT